MEKRTTVIRKHTVQIKTYDSSISRPVIRASICTGEKTAGFKNLETGKFTEVMLIQTAEDLREFKDMYGITGDIETIY